MCYLHQAAASWLRIQRGSGALQPSMLGSHASHPPSCLPINVDNSVRSNNCRRISSTAPRAATAPPAQQQVTAVPSSTGNVKAAEGQGLLPHQLHDSATSTASTRHVRAFLTCLSQYTPTGLSDGPASLTQVCPYNAAAFHQALQQGAQLLPKYLPAQLANIAAALAAAGHRDEAFMDRLGSEAVRQLQTAGTPNDQAGSLGQLRSISYLAAAFARLGLVHAELFTELAVQGARLLRKRDLRLTKRSHGTHITLLAAAYCALKLYPPQLFRSITELLKQQRLVLRLLGPQEAMLLCWSLARLQHCDLPAQLLLTQRAASQVGQLDCQGLAHAYSQAGSARLTAPPLLAALRKAVRQRLPNMQPHQLTAVLVSLTALGQQDQLLLDELAKAIHSKLANFTAAQIVTVFSSCSLLQYRNPWLLEHASKMLVSRKMHKVAQVTGQQLSDLLVACRQLQYFNPLLLALLGTTAGADLVENWSGWELAGVLHGYQLEGYQHPQLLQAAAARLQQLAEALQDGEQDQLANLVAAAHALASMPGVGVGSSQPIDATVAAVLAVAAAAMQLAPALSCTELVVLATASVLCGLLPAGDAAAPAKASGANAAHNKQEQQELNMQQSAADLVQQVLGSVQQRSFLLESVTDISQDQRAMASLLHLMQLLWLKQCLSNMKHVPDHWQEQQSAAPPRQASQLQRDLGQGQQQQPAVEGSGNPQHTQASKDGQQQPMWRLGLSQQALLQILKVQTEVWQQQQHGPLLQAVLFGMRQATVKSAAGVVQMDMNIVSPYRIPDSPVLLAAALFPAASSSIQGAAADTTGARKVHAGFPDKLDSNRFLVVGLRQHQVKSPLPKNVMAFVQARITQRSPVAVFVAGNAAGGMDDWHSSSVPRVLLPGPDLYMRGLQAAGWAVLVLYGKPDDS